MVHTRLSGYLEELFLADHDQGSHAAEADDQNADHQSNVGVVTSLGSVGIHGRDGFGHIFCLFADGEFTNSRHQEGIAVGSHHIVAALGIHGDGVGTVAVVGDGVTLSQSLALVVIDGDGGTGVGGEDGVPVIVIAGLIQLDGQGLTGGGGIVELLELGVGIGPEVAVAVDEGYQMATLGHHILQAPAGGIIQPVAVAVAGVTPQHTDAQTPGGIVGAVASGGTAFVGSLMGSVQGIIYIEDAVVVDINDGDGLLEQDHIALVSDGDEHIHFTLGGLVVGVSLTADGAEAVLVVVAQGIDYGTGDDRAAVGAGLVAGVAILGAGGILGTGNGGVGMGAVLQSLQQGFAVSGGCFLAKYQIVVGGIAVFRSDFDADSHRLGVIPEVDGVAVMALVGGSDRDLIAGIAFIDVGNRVDLYGGVGIGGSGPYVLEGTAAACGQHGVIVGILREFRGQDQSLAGIGIAFVDFQLTQGRVSGDFPDGNGVGAAVAVLQNGDLSSSNAILQRHGDGLGAAALTGGGVQGDAGGAHGDDPLNIRIGCGELAIQGAHISSQSGEICIVGANCKDRAAVVLIVDGAINAADGAGDAVLLIALGIVDLDQLCAIGGIDGGIHGDQAQAAGLAVVSGVAVELAGLLQISIGNQNAALGVCLQCHGVVLLQGIRIGHDEVAAAAGADHNAAAAAKVDLIAVNHGSAGALVGLLGSLQVGQLAGGGVHLGGAQVAIFGGEVDTALGFAVGHGGALVTAAGEGQVGNDGAVILVHAVHMGVAGIAAGAVVGAHDHSVTQDNGTGPVEAAGDGLVPDQAAVGHINTDVVGILIFAVPEAGVNAAVGVSNGRKRLAAQGILINPDGFQSFGVKGLDGAAGQGAEDQTVSIGAGGVAEVGRGRHGGLLQNLARLQIQLIQGGAGHNDQGVVHDDLHAGVGAPTGAKLFGPLQNGGLGACGSLGAGQSHVHVRIAEVGPIGGHVVGVLPRNSDFCVGRRRNAVAQGPDIPLAVSVGGDNSLAVFIGGGGLGLRVQQGLAIADLVADLGNHAHGQPAVVLPALGSGSQGNSQCFTLATGIAVGHIAVTVQEVAETGRRIGVEAPVGIAGQIHIIAGLQGNVVSGSAHIHGVAPGFRQLGIQRVATVVVVGHVFGEAEQSAAEIQGAGHAATIDIAPIAAVQLFVGVDEQVQGSDIIGTVIVGIIEIVAHAVFG